MELSKRLSCVASMVTKGNRVCDVGCDHGYVSIYLVQNQIAPAVIAMDINKGPLERAKEHIAGTQLSDKIETRLSDGMKNLKMDEADTLICAGMGGRLVIHILENDMDKLLHMKEMVLQPQSELDVVRAYLREKQFTIDKEDMIFEDGKYYPVLHVLVPKVNAEKAGTCSSPDRNAALENRIFDLFGQYPLENQNPVLKEYLFFMKNLYESILAEFQKKEKTEKQKQREKEIRIQLKEIEEAFSYF